MVLTRFHIGLCLLPLLLPAPAPAQGYLYQFLGAEKYFLGVSFPDSAHGTVVGVNGVILHTTDGGASWSTQLSHTTKNLSAVSFPDASHGTVVGDDGTVLRTSDGGQTWSYPSGGSGLRLAGVSFVDSAFGVAVGSAPDWSYYPPHYYPVSFKTTDGGANWFGWGLPSWVGEGLFSVSFKNRDTGLAVGGSNLIYRTVDGTNWSRVSPEGTETWLGVALGPNNVAIVVGTSGIFRSTDAGLTWSFIQGGEFHTVAFGDSSHTYAAGPNVLVQSSDGGLHWEEVHPPHYFNAVSANGAATMVAVGDHGVILRSVGSLTPTPVTLLSPANDTVGVRFELSGLSAGIRFRWIPYPYTRLRPAYYWIEVSSDSSFSTLHEPARIIPLTNPDSSTVIYGDFEPATTYYWRIKAGEGNPGYYAVSERWRFTTADYPRISLREIQYVDSNSLHLADLVQNAPGYDWYQNSPRMGQFVFITGRCVVPPFGVSGSNGQMRLALCDTGLPPSAWRGLVLTNATATRFANVQRGDIIQAQGRVDENLRGMNSATEFATSGLRIVSTSPATPLPPIPVRIADFYRGAFPGGSVTYSTGEQYEGSLVELHDVTVYSIANATQGTIYLVDETGNTLRTSDLSSWFTLRSHRDPASTYAVPPPGTVIETLRGLITAEGDGYCIAPLNPEDMVLGTQRHGSISGTIFQDRNQNHLRDGHEPGVPSWSVEISGKVHVVLTTDASGVYSLGGLDTGTYTATVMQIPQNWTLTTARSQTFRLDQLDGTAGGNDFGAYFPWNGIVGHLYYDQDGNGRQDPGEPGLANWLVRLSGESNDSVLTESTGTFVLGGVFPGTNTVSLVALPGWEQIIPHFQGSYVLDIETFEQYYSGAEFGVHPIPGRLKFPITIHDNTSFAHRDIWWGFRLGASYGIFGIDLTAKTTDFAEGEFEIPPQTPGLFDGRFEDARGGIFRFGYGSWTDMRDYVFPAQVDSFKITFAPGYAYGGDYPVTISWHRDSIARNFSGAVTIAPTGTPPTDMKLADSIVIANPSVSSVTFVTRGPRFPAYADRQWKLISLPTPQRYATAQAIFPTMNGSAFAYYPPSGYARNESLVPGRGYWVRYSSVTDSLRILGSPRTADTLAIASGWNLIGSLSLPVDVASVSTIPADILKGPFFGYDKRYVFADTLEPGAGYWVNAKEAGTMILASHLSTAPKVAGEPGLYRRLLDRSCRLAVSDANGNTGELFFLTEAERNGAEPFDLPPTLPSGAFDLRFASSRGVEFVRNGGEYPVSLRAERYPVTIRWMEPPAGLDAQAVVASVKIGGRTIALEAGAVVRLEEEPAGISLLVSSGDRVPTEYVLDQNYPNPFNPVTSIRYGLPERSHVTVAVFDLLGRMVRGLVDGVEEAGYHTVSWDGTAGDNAPAASGLYFCRFSAPGPQPALQIRKMLLLR